MIRFLSFSCRFLRAPTYSAHLSTENDKSHQLLFTGWNNSCSGILYWKHVHIIFNAKSLIQKRVINHASARICYHCLFLLSYSRQLFSWNLCAVVLGAVIFLIMSVKLKVKTSWVSSFTSLTFKIFNSCENYAHQKINLSQFS